MLYVGTSNDAVYMNIIYMGVFPKNTGLLCCTVYDHKNVYTHTHTHEDCVHAHAHTRRLCTHTRTHTKTNDMLYMYDIFLEYDAIHMNNIWCNTHESNMLQYTWITYAWTFSTTQVCSPVLHTSTQMCTRMRAHTSRSYMMYIHDIYMDFTMNAGLLFFIVYTRTNMYVSYICAGDCVGVSVRPLLRTC